MKLIALEDACIRDQAIIQNSKVTRKLSLQAKSFVDLRSCAAHRKKIRVFSAFCLRSRAGYVKRAETLRLSGVSDPKKKIASDRESTIFPAIASSRYPPLLRSRAHKSQFPIGALPQHRKVHLLSPLMLPLFPKKTDLWFLKNDPTKEKRPEKGRWSRDSDSSSKTLILASIKLHRALERLAGS